MNFKDFARAVEAGSEIEIDPSNQGMWEPLDFSKKTVLDILKMIEFGVIRVKPLVSEKATRFARACA